MNTKQPVQHERNYYNSNVGQAVQRESFYSFSRSNEWIKLLHALGQQETYKLHPLEHQNATSPLTHEKNGIKETKNTLKQNGDFAKWKDNAAGDIQSQTPDAKAYNNTEKSLPGWPLLSASKISLQKCKKCSQEFYSMVNYRRHIRMHRRTLNIEKICPLTRELLHSFWDERSLNEKKEILSFSDASLGDVSGTSILRTLTSSVLRSGLVSLPQSYARAGVSLSDAIQASPSKCPLSAEELLSTLDDASEKTFLCAGSAVSLQKFVFDGHVANVALDMKNVIACASFLLEQKLVKAWLAHKDVESLRCQKLLMEEEEAAQNRKAQILERKRLKKLRLREHRAKGHSDGNKADVNRNSSDNAEAVSCAESPSSGPLSGHELSNPEISFGSSTESLASIESSLSLEEAVITPDVETDSGGLLTDCFSQPESNQRQVVASENLVLKATKALGNQGPSARSMVLKRSFKVSKHGSSVNCQMVWARKNKDEKDPIPGNKDESEEEMADQTDSSTVLIGSITVPLEGHNVESVGQNDLSEGSTKVNYFLNSGNRMVKLWRPVSRPGAVDSSTFLSSKKQVEFDSDGAVMDCSATTNSKTVLESARYSVPQLFSTEVAVAFLAKRWKDALASEHVKFDSLEAPDTDVHMDDSSSAEQKPPSDYSGRSILGNTENRMAVLGRFDLANNSFYTSKIKVKLDKNHRVKYIPKQKD